MTTPLIAGPLGGNDPQGSSSHPGAGKRGAKRAQPKPLNKADILLAIQLLTQMVTAGQIKTANFNSALNGLKALLDAIEDGNPVPTADRVLPEALKDVLRVNPTLLDFFSAWLSVDELTELLNGEE